MENSDEISIINNQFANNMNDFSNNSIGKMKNDESDKRKIKRKKSQDGRVSNFIQDSEAVPDTDITGSRKKRKSKHRSNSKSKIEDSLLDVSGVTAQNQNCDGAENEFLTFSPSIRAIGSEDVILSSNEMIRKKKSKKTRLKECVKTDNEELEDESSLVCDLSLKIPRDISDDVATHNTNDKRNKKKKKSKKRSTDIESDIVYNHSVNEFREETPHSTQIVDAENKGGGNISPNSKLSAQFPNLSHRKTVKSPSQKKANCLSNGCNDSVKSSLSTGCKGRPYTISIAVPASILKEAKSRQELKTYVIGQLARTACIYSVDEIVVYNDNGKNLQDNQEDEEIGMMKMILEYQECPQYLRKSLFHRHPYMAKAGVLNPLNAAHHFLSHEWSPYREGVVLSQSSQSSIVDVGLSSHVKVDRKISTGVRVTVNFPPEAESLQRKYGFLVSPDEPRVKAGLYWGYTVRVANCFAEIFNTDRFKAGYDLIIGTSDKGTDAANASLPHFSHALIVFGGVRGLEATMAVDKSAKVSDPKVFFPYYLNVCPDQSSRTIRTEEAVMITLTVLTPMLKRMGKSG